MSTEHAVVAWPLVVPANKTSTIHVGPSDASWNWRNDVPYRVTYYPVEEFAQQNHWPQQNTAQVHAEDGELPIPWFFEGEQEHVLIIQDDGPNGPTLPAVEIRVYSVRADLLHRRPFKGDFHLHSRRSDGQELPAYVAAASRRIGLDFMAVTDHGQYAPSLEAIDAFADIPHDLTIYPGEEVHPPKNPVHMIHFGGDHSVNALFASERYRDGVADIQAALTDLPQGVDPYEYASCLWCFQEMRRAGGLGVFCHPYWFTQHRYSPSGALTSKLFETQPFDAFELIGGYWLNEVASNQLQVARYHEERAQGRRIPIVGASDAHGCERGLFGWYYTIVYAPSTQLDDLCEGIASLYSVAIEALPGETVRPVGPFRLVKYTLFLLEHVLPQHDALCAREGHLMMHWLGGDDSAKETLATLSGQTAELYDRLWCD